MQVSLFSELVFSSLMPAPVEFPPTPGLMDYIGLGQGGYFSFCLYPWNKGAPDTNKLLPGTIFAVSGVRDST